MRVVAIKKGFHKGERNPGDVFECPKDKKGQDVMNKKISWYVPATEEQVVKAKQKDKAADKDRPLA